MRVKTTLLAVAALPMFLAAVAAQNLVINVNLRVLDFVVEDDRGRPVLDLTADDLEVIEDGRWFPVTHLSLENDPVAFGLLVDRSSSIAPVRKTLEEAVNDVLKAAGPEDQAFIVTFAGEATLRASLTSDPKRIPQSVGNPKLQLGTRFYDVLVDSLDYLANQSSLGRKALVVVSDGADHFSRHTFEQALTAAVTYGYPVFVIGLFGDDPLTQTVPGREEVRSRLVLLASLTGGKAFFPANWTECPRLVNQIFEHLHYRYRLGFYNPEPSKTHEDVQIRLRTPGSRRIIMRSPRPATFTF